MGENKLKESKAEKHMDVGKYSINRELSWLNFNRRVLYEAIDENTPIFEGLKFVSIFDSNLEEFYRVRVGSLTDLSYVKEAKPDNKTGMTPKEQLNAIYKKTKILLKEKDEVFENVTSNLLNDGIEDVDFSKLDKKEKKLICDYFESYILPILSPRIIDYHHPFPFLDNNKLYILLDLKSENESTYGLIQIPDSFNRTFYLDRKKVSFIRIENIIENLVGEVFSNYKINKSFLFTVYRNADINIEEYLKDTDEYSRKKDFKDFMKIILKRRTRLQAVAVLSNRRFPKELRNFLSENLNIQKSQFFVTNSPLIMDYVFSLEDKIKEKNMTSIMYKSLKPNHNNMLKKNKSYIDQVLKKDVLFIYPYEDIEDFIRLLNEAAVDKRVKSIKITIYRLAKSSKIVRALVKAAENNKEVSVLMELQARFDEESNINYADILLEAGCDIIYGISGYKVHSKLCLITLEDDDGYRYITQIGTGNYNEKTSTQYTDLSLITSDTKIANDALEVFKDINTGNVKGDYEELLVSPNTFKPKLIEYIDKEIEKGKKGRIFFKFNSFTDKDLMTKLSEASNSGVKVRLIIRGISCLRPGIKGYTENIEIRSIVGRFLEHPRIFIFGDGDDSKVFIGSADLMTRNTEKRIEVTTPVKDNESKNKIIDYMNLQWKDNSKSRIMNVYGEYEKVTDDEKIFNSQDYMIENI